MASINERKNTTKRNTVYIYYRHREESGKTRQITVACQDRQEAERILPDVQKAEAENRIYAKPQAAKRIETITELLDGYFAYQLAKNGWRPSTYDNYLRLRRNYVDPAIGDKRIAEVSRGFMYTFYDELRLKDAMLGNHITPPPKISARTVKEINKILCPAFEWAVDRELIPFNPLQGMKKAPYTSPKREQWTVEEFKTALSLCTDETLSLVMATMFFGTLRSCEAAGLKWDCVDCSSEHPSIQIEREIVVLDRTANRDTHAAEHIEEIFSQNSATKRVIVLQRTLKTNASNRKIYIPPALAQQLKAHRERQEALRTEFPDFPQNGLVFEHDFGRPFTANLLNNRFKRFIRRNGLREVDMYSLRHSGATEKLRRTRDIKAVQADMGHTTSQMLLNVYATVPEEDRRKTANDMNDILDGKN